MERVLLVEDDRITNVALHDYLQEVGFEVESAYSGADALASIERQPPRSLVIDLDLGPGPDGFEVARLARVMRPDVWVVLISPEAERRRRSGEVAASELVAKPFRFERIEEALRGALDRPVA
ncbi:MAG: response regulator [Phenylobacterium sp.]|uniref:response regulator n=1 Tax=Phenylobacterium sp. TaxID=1871053 RepID=UPI001220955E|nr:response regulator [Phenylobacterium sp.]TAJ72545.1 MAG: response regulator [Phenylobacterium sp.]